MAHVVQMPRLSDSMETGKVLRWLKKVGDPVRRGEVIAEIETDKATLELESPFAGVLAEIKAEVGADVPVGAPIAVIADPGEQTLPLGQEAVAATEAPIPEVPPAESEVPAAPGPPEAAQASEKPTTEPEPAPPRHDAKPAGGRVKATPLARKMARRYGIDLTKIKGTGPGGRITLGDVEGYLEAIGKGSAAPGETPAPAPAGETEAVEPTTLPVVAAAPEEGVVIPLSKMRLAIARRVTEGKFSAPHFYARIAVETGPATLVKQALAERYTDRRISWTAILIRAVALALRDVKRLNASYLEVDGVPAVHVHDVVHMGVAVAVDEGLVMPVLRDVHAKPIPVIAKELADLAERTRAGKLRAEELTGATFTISNLGMAGIEEFTAIIPPGQAGILAVGSISDEVTVREGQVQVVQRLRATLSADHRVVDGWGAAEFLQAFKKYLENPAWLLIEG